MDPIFLIVLAIQLMIGTWIIGTVLHKNTKSMFLCWLFIAASLPFLTAIIWAAIRVYFSPEIATEIIKFYFAAFVAPVVDNLPEILLSVFVGTVLGIIMTALTGGNFLFPTRYKRNRSGS